jgi:16S rRNA (cytosine967-C5)-methyltransferase
MTPERAAYNILLKITRENAFANLALKDELKNCGSVNTARVTALVYTAIEHINYCDSLINSFAKGRLHHSIRCILRLALGEAFFMDAPDHAVCTRAVELTRGIGKDKLTGYVNGVLRSILRAKENGALPELPADFGARMELLTGYPKFIAEEYAAVYGAENAEKLMTARVKGTVLRPCFPHTAVELKAHLDSLGVKYRESELVPGSLIADSLGADLTEDPLFGKGAFTVQSEGASLACIALDPKPGMRILDACAAPGGKTACIADLSERKARITAWDIHPHRVELIKNTLARLGIDNAECEVLDASIFDMAFEESFDAVLCDVPCSGMGGGSKPDALMRRTKESIEELAVLQLRILLACSQYVKTGGALVYSTCTVSKKENEGVIERFLQSGSGFELVPLDSYVPEKLRERGKTGMLTLLPSVDGAEGFFIAKLIRKV